MSSSEPWSWTRGYYVLTRGCLFYFRDTAIGAKLHAAQPILGADVQRVQPSSRSYPHVMQITLNFYFEDDPLHNSCELAAPSSAELARWIGAMLLTRV